MDLSLIDSSETFQGKTLLITGGTGSFGNAVLSRLQNFDLKEIRIFSRDEKKQDEMRREKSDQRIKFIVGDIRDYESIADAMRGVDFVFHAAALKQVPSCEFYPMEAVRTNILGAENVIRAAVESEVSRVVVLSTDKAVYPINAMGLTKAMMERLMIAKARSLGSEAKTIFCATRYGNVMASRGSVIPLFISQLKQGSQLTVTDPEMTRFLMSLEDSVDLVLHAFHNGQGGDIFVQKAPASTIQVLAEALIKVFDANSSVKIIGTRHGEKLYESLLSREEMAKAIESQHYYRVPMDSRDLNYGEYFDFGERHVSGLEDYTSHNTTRLNVEETSALLMKLPLVQENLNA